MYKINQIEIDGGIAHLVNIQRLSDDIFIPFDPANTDYQAFKAQINADEAQLEDADGVLMSPEEAKAFVATLP